MCSRLIAYIAKMLVVLVSSCNSCQSPQLLHISQSVVLLILGQAGCAPTQQLAREFIASP
jgi:hypothetical protein